MTKANDFVRALQAARDPAVESVDAARKRQQDAWLGDLAAFAQVIRKWLVPVVEAKLASVVEKEFPIEEPDLGSYTAPGLAITLVVGAAPRTVLLGPRGMRIVGVVQSGGARVTGARGRVDLECGVAREILLRFGDKQETKWASFSKGEKETVNEDVFFQLLE